MYIMYIMYHLIYIYIYIYNYNYNGMTIYIYAYNYNGEKMIRFEQKSSQLILELPSQ